MTQGLFTSMANAGGMDVFAALSAQGRAEHLLGLMPFFVLLVALGAALLVEALAPRLRGLCAAVAVVGFLGAAWVALSSAPPGLSIFRGELVYDAIGRTAMLTSLAVGVFVALVSPLFLSRHDRPSGEYYSLLILAVMGMALLSISRGFVSLFISLEIASLGVYVLAILDRRLRAATEASMKYFLLGALSSAFVAMGIAFLYGACGGVTTEALREALAGGALDAAQRVWLTLGAALFLAGFAFKVTLVPFHLYAPDVYEGAPTPIATLISTGSKISAFAALAGVLLAATPMIGEAAAGWQAPMNERARAALWFLAAASMIVGNLLAVAQPNIKRLLAFSSIAHSGYLAVGLLAVMAGGAGAERAFALYLVAYALMTMLAFGIASTLGSRGETSVRHYAGLARRSPALALMMALAMVSLTGIPPTVGFAGKLEVFKSAVGAGYVGLVVLAVLSSVWSAFYYLRVVVYIYMVEPEHEWKEVRTPLANALALGVCSVLILILGFAPGALDAIGALPK